MTRREPESTRSAEAGSDIESVAEETNDAELVHRTLAGDHRAFTLLYRRHAPLLFRRLRRVLFQRQDVHDVLQQTFLEMYRNLSRYRADKSFSAWLLGFSFKITGHYLRAHKRHQRLQLVPAASLEERNVDGFSVHANVAVRASERKRLEKVARYIARPPIATERLEELEDGRIQYRLRRPWSKVSFGVATSFSEGRSRCVSKVILMSSCQKADHSAATFAKAHRESYSECGSSVGRPIGSHWKTRICTRVGVAFFAKTASCSSFVRSNTTGIEQPFAGVSGSSVIARSSRHLATPRLNGPDTWPA